MTQAGAPTATLLVVGAGPKALALHVKASILRELGYPVPDVLIVEHQGVGAHWRGGVGYTNGKYDLVNKPEKDLGFPYRCKYGREADRRMLKYSWQAYKCWRAEYADWVDGDRPEATHSEWADYLQWAKETSHANVVEGKVARIEVARDEWAVTYSPNDSPGASRHLRAAGIVISGPGDARRLDQDQDDHPNISDGKSFWLPPCLEDFANLKSGRIAVIGGGDTAAAAVVGVLDALHPSADVEIQIFIPRGMSLSRGWSFGEQQWFSDPGGWNKLARDARQQFIQHTERGVFSPALKKRIDKARNVRILPKRVVTARMKGKEVVVAFHDGTKSQPFRRAIVATGFKPWYFYKLFPDWKLFPFFSRRKLYEEKELFLAEKIRYDLSYTARWKPKLFLPSLAGLKQGPGFPNLSCLGLLSDRILGSFLDDHGGHGGTEAGD
jgi:mycobactin lysine-N-oxygenase